MSGVPGAGGVVPKRSDQRRRTNAPNIPIDKAPGAAEVPVPPADPDWHPIALAWYESLTRSGQAVFYEPSDWGMAVYVAEAMSRNVSSERMSAQMFAAVMSAMTELLTSEGARRRLRIELQREPAAETKPRVSSRDRLRAV